MTRCAPYGIGLSTIVGGQPDCSTQMATEACTMTITSSWMLSDVRTLTTPSLSWPGTSAVVGSNSVAPGGLPRSVSLMAGPSPLARARQQEFQGLHSLVTSAIADQSRCERSSSARVSSRDPLEDGRPRAGLHRHRRREVFPAIEPGRTRSRRNTFVASYEYFRDRGLRAVLTTRGRGFAASASRRRALSRDQPVFATTSSKSLPCCFFDALAYAVAYFAVISTRADIDNSLPCHDRRRFAGILSESRRQLAFIHVMTYTHYCPPVPRGLPAAATPNRAMAK